MKKSALMLSLPGSNQVESYLENSAASTHFTWANHDQSRVWDIPMEKVSLQEPPELFVRPAEEIPYTTGHQEYLDKVQHTVAALRQNGWDKIVLSRAQVESDSHKEAPFLFRALAEKYPQACVYLFTHPEAGTWLGATPETLLRKQGTKLTTMSLAGTRSTAERNLFSEKEKQEQQLVTDFIAEALRQTPGLSAIDIAPPSLVQAGQVWHFQTLMQARAEFHFKLSHLLQKLHPTPAVAGVPRDAALQYLAQNEGYPRAFYSGYFGLRQKENAHYFVNLRCMQLFENYRALYAGGGITVHSNAEREWRETEEKLQTLKTAWQHA